MAQSSPRPTTTQAGRSKVNPLPLRLPPVTRSSTFVPLMANSPVATLVTFVTVPASGSACHWRWHALPLTQPLAELTLLSSTLSACHSATPSPLHHLLRGDL